MMIPYTTAGEDNTTLRRPRHRWWLACAGLLCLLLSPAVGQTLSPQRLLGRYQQSIWTDQHGLPQNGISAVAQTPDGYLWLATAEGVVRFDGVRFTAFDTSNTPEIKSNNIMSLLVDRTGALWIGTHAGGLSRYKDGRFTLYTTQDGLSNSHVWSLLEDRAGNIWIGTDGGGLNLFRDGRFTVYTNKDGLPDNHVSSLAEDASGNLWIGTTSGLAQFKDSHITAYRTREGGASDNISSLRWDHAGNLWVGRARGLTTFREGRFTNYDDRVKHKEVQTIYQDRVGSLWFGTIGGGLYRFKEGRFDACTTQNGLASDVIQAVYQDPQGDLWLGTSGSGLVQLRNGLIDVYTMAEGLPHDMIGAIYEDAAGGVWVGTAGGLSRFTDEKFTVFATLDGQPSRRLHTISGDGAGNVLIGAGGKILQFQAGHFTTHTAQTGLTFLTFLIDRANNLWVGTPYDGLHYFRDGHRTTYHKQDGLADEYVCTLYEDRQGSLWIGTRSGLSRFKAGRFTTWTAKEGFAGNHVLSFYEDRTGALWVGTHGDGLFRFKDEKFAVITTRQGLYDNLAFQILEDDGGNLWMSGNKGIYRARLKELNDLADGRIAAVQSFAYGAADGMLSRECNGASPAGVKTRDGRLWFPTIKGVAVVDPRKLNQQPPLVAIERVLLDSQALPADQSLQIRPGQENLEIQYTALNWSRPQQISFKYQLVGQDETWVEAGTRRTAYYSYLPPGAYTFRVIADNGDGVWNLTGQSLRLTVLPPFYRTWWFIALAFVALASLAWLAYRTRIAQLHRRQAAQEEFARQLIASQEGERKRIAAELHDGLGQNLLVIKNRAALAKLTSQDLPTAFQQLDQIADSALQAIQEARQIAYNLRPHHLDSIGLTRSLEEMLRRVEETSGLGIACEIASLEGALPKAMEINFYRIVQEAVSNIVKHAQATRAGVEIERLPERLLLTVRDNGCGFDVQAASGRDGFGLTGIAERARILGGNYRVESEPGKGTTIVVELPLTKQEPKS